MASTSASLEMSLQKFYSTNFSFWKEQMQDYMIVMGQIEPIENKSALDEYEPNEWTKLNWIAHATNRMHLFEMVYYTR